MIDISKLEINPIPQKILELQNSNLELKDKNKLLKNIMILGVIFISMVVLDDIITHFNKEYERENRKKS